MAMSSTTILQSGKEATCIRIPPEIVEGLGAGKVPRVVVPVNGYTYRSTVAVMGGEYMVSFSSASTALPPASRAATAWRWTSAWISSHGPSRFPLTSPSRWMRNPRLGRRSIASPTATRAGNLSQVTGAKTDETRQPHREVGRDASRGPRSLKVLRAVAPGGGFSPLSDAHRLPP